MFCAFEVKFVENIDKMLLKISERGVSATLLNADALYSMQHLRAAYELASFAIKEKKAIGKREESEFLLWLGCSAHMKNAIARAGAKSGKNCVLAVFGKKEGECARIAKKLGIEIVGKVRKNKEALNYWGIGKSGAEADAKKTGFEGGGKLEKAGLKKKSDEQLKKLIEKMATARI